jgi:DNA-binding transcriptional LysR family regulator
MDRITQLQLFIRMVDCGSLSGAAEQLGLSNAAASRHLGALEDRLGARLIERTTRRHWLTEAGRIYHERCSVLLQELEEADAAVNEATVNPTGLLRVACSTSFAMLHIAPGLPEFYRRYPNLTVEVAAVSRYLDLIESGIDVAIRTREYEPDSNITVRRLAETNRILAASPAYLTECGVPCEPEDLARHRLLIHILARDPFVLQFRRGDETRSVQVRSALHSNEGQVICAAALAGHGILAQPLFIIQDSIAAGRLTPVLTDWELPRLTINLAYQKRRHQPARIRVFNEFLIERFATLEPENAVRAGAGAALRQF